MLPEFVFHLRLLLRNGYFVQTALTPRRLGTALAPIALACTALGALSVPAALATALLFGARPAASSPMLVLAGLVLVFVACGSTALVLSGLFVITRHALVYEPVIIAPVLLLSGLIGIEGVDGI